MRALAALGRREEGEAILTRLEEESRQHYVRAEILAMGYGALAVALVATLEGTPWTFDARPAYILSLLYLAAFGSVVAFGAYLTLLGKIGAARAGYVGVAVPVVALMFSTVFEHYQWTLLALLGVALCAVGNVLVLVPQKPARTEDKSFAAKAERIAKKSG